MNTHNHDIRNFYTSPLQDADPEIYSLIQAELQRQQSEIELIASENTVSKAVLEAQGSILTNKYAEGYPGKRYYAGCQVVDQIENLAIDRAKKLFNVNFANVQPHSGCQANQAVFFALLNPGDTILGLSLSSGGHLTHGAQVSMSGKWFNAISYDVSVNDYLIDYDLVETLALKHKPSLIIAGCSSYPRFIDFTKFKEISQKIGAYLMVDMAHFAGQVAAGLYPSPVNCADVITTTTHKTLRGTRGGMILTNDEVIAKKINSAVFPGIQGGPLLHSIAAKAVAFKEALNPSYKVYMQNVIDNAKTLADILMKRNYDVLTCGTDCHLLLIDLRRQGLTGKLADHNLNKAGIVCNKNSIPFEHEKPFVTSGIRLGTPASTSRGFGKVEFEKIGNMIADVLDHSSENNDPKINEVHSLIEDKVKKEVAALCQQFPIY
ncbi:serine hydroxymethyltransferase [Rickettsiales endosymbiont of Peranema trichophorum]|uniref:serine hydroxymethyltransferase n=1 Tax=Rickettsiales endosymbiont of Peranema trichophorum TaxID=2486577 RepID=UPI001023E648|nr:serine hydroxymethyltransferase [Rickettsiales endosymbiont of Peranema trichophorum]RZI45997.1 serine hydroxymethyltransferase [Rickettsiales endosymbiont of Peranema trichophorum]